MIYIPRNHQTPYLQMIRKEKINELHPPIKEAVVELFNYCIEKQKNPGDFVLFLENGSETDKPQKGLSKYMVGIGEEGIADFDRLEFFSYYLRTSFYDWYDKSQDKKEKEKILKLSLHLEMMIIHIFGKRTLISRRGNS